MPIISTGFEEFDDKIIVYPNPANNYFLVEAVSTELIEVIIFDAFGKLIRTEQEYSNTKINVSGLANGLYIVMIKGNKTSLQEKILIQH
jgi:aminopeptidase YwaD